MLVVAIWIPVGKSMKYLRFWISGGDMDFNRTFVLQEQVKIYFIL